MKEQIFKKQVTWEEGWDEDRTHPMIGCFVVIAWLTICLIGISSLTKIDGIIVGFTLGMFTTLGYICFDKARPRGRKVRYVEVKE